MLGYFQKRKNLVDLFLQKKRYIIQPLDCEIPLCKIKKYVDSKDNIIGYRFECPSTAIIKPKSIIIGKSSGVWKPYISMPGIQVYTNETAVAILVSTVSDYMGKIK